MKSLRKRIIWIALITLLLIIGIPTVLTVREYWRQHRDRALIAAIKKNDTATAIALLDAGADANTVDRPENSHSYKDILNEFWQRVRGKKPVRDMQPYNPALMIQLHRNPYQVPLFAENPPLLQALLEHGANPNVKDTEGNSALYEAASSHYHASVSLLLEHGAKPDPVNAAGETPLMAADTESTRLLLAHGARVNLRDLYGKSALAISVASPSKALLLLAQGAEVNTRDSSGKTPLMYVGGGTTLEMVSLLAAHGADVNSSDGNGWTPLMHLTRRGEKEAAEVLWKHGVQIDAQDATGETALVWAIRGTNSPEMISWLIAHGAKVGLHDNRGRTALDHAGARWGPSNNLIPMLKAALRKEQRQLGRSK